MNAPPLVLRESLLKRTTSRCPICYAPCPAKVVRIGEHPGRVELRRTCAVHGAFSVCIASDARFYWLSKGDARNVVADPDAKYFGAVLDKDGLAPTGKFIAGRIRFADWARA